MLPIKIALLQIHNHGLGKGVFMTSVDDVHTAKTPVGQVCDNPRC